MRFYQLKEEILPAALWNAIPVSLKKPFIFNFDVRREVFPERLVGRGSIVEYYYDSLVYNDWNFGGSCFKTYDDSIMKGAKVIFPELESRLLESAIFKSMMQQFVRTLPALYCRMCFMKGRRSLARDEMLEGWKRRKKRKKMLNSIRPSIRSARHPLPRMNYLLLRGCETWSTVKCYL